MRQERRRAPRAPGEEVKIKIYAEDRNPYLEEGLLLDVSTRGICFLADKILNLDEKIILEFVLWKKFEFFLLGKIVWIRKDNGGYRYGFEFIRIEPIEEVRLRKFVHAKLQKKIRYIL